MKILQIIIILFFSSSLLLLPILDTTEQYILTPKSPVQIIKTIQTPSLEITSDVGSAISLNISLMNPNTENLSNIYNDTFIAEEQIDNLEVGTYLFVFLSPSITNIEIREVGIVTNTLFIPGALFLVLFLVYMKRVIFPPLEY